MAYYGGYSNNNSAYPGQQQQYSMSYDPQQQQQQSYAQQYGGYSSGLATIPQTTPSATAQTQQAPTASSSYKVNLPAYYAGPSYSTTSDNDFNFNSLPVVGNNINNLQMGAYGPQDQSQNQQQSAYGVSYPTGASTDPYAQYAGYATSQQQQQQILQQPHSSRSHRSTSSQQAPHLTTNSSAGGADDFSQLAPQIEAAYEAATHHRRQPVIKRQVITVPGTPGKIQQVVRRLPTPTPDIVERVFIVKPQRDVVNLVIERPGTPPAQYKDRTVMGKQRRPLINPRIIRVAPRQNSLSGYYQYPFQQQQQQQQYYPAYYQQQQQPQYQQYIHALPAPSPLLNVQTVRIPPSSSSTYQNYQQQQQQPLTDQQQQQLVSSALEQQSQGQVSQAQISQHSQQHSASQVHMLPPSQSSQQPLLSSGGGISSAVMGPKGYLIAPIQYDDQLLSNNPYGNVNFAQGMMMNQMMQQQQPQGYGQGYSTGFPSQGFSAMPSSAYPVYGR